MCEPGNTLWGTSLFHVCITRVQQGPDLQAKLLDPTVIITSALQKPFPKAGKPQRSSSLYTMLQYFQPPNAQGITSVYCSTASQDSLWAIVYLSSPRTSLWTLQMLVRAALQEFIHRNRLPQSRPSVNLLTPFPIATANTGCRHM